MSVKMLPVGWEAFVACSGILMPVSYFRMHMMGMDYIGQVADSRSWPLTEESWSISSESSSFELVH